MTHVALISIFATRRTKKRFFVLIFTITRYCLFAGYFSMNVWRIRQKCPMPTREREDYSLHIASLYSIVCSLYMGWHRSILSCSTFSVMPPPCEVKSTNVGCFWMSTTGERNITYDEGVKICKEGRSYVAVVKSPEDYDVITTMLRKHWKVGKHGRVTYANSWINGTIDPVVSLCGHFVDREESVMF